MASFVTFVPYFSRASNVSSAWASVTLDDPRIDAMSVVTLS